MGDIWDTIEQDVTRNPITLAKDSAKVQVYCSRDVWQNHILAYHPEVRELRDLILQAIERPEIAENDPEDKRVKRYYVSVTQGRIKSEHTFWLRVVVKYVYPAERNRERTGLLSSVYLIRKKGQSR